MPDASRQSPSLRFGLGGLLELIAAIGLLLALVTQLGCFGFVLAVTGLLVVAAAGHWVLAEDHKDAKRRVRNWGIVSALPLALALFVSSMIGTYREKGRYTQCYSNLYFITTALHHYHDANGHFPPAFVADAAGRPMHSWRALLLPYMEAQDLYKAYDFTEPWDGPNNSKLAAQMPRSFRCPSDHQMPDGMTNYFFVTGPGRLKTGTQQQTLTDFKDPQTILLVESSSARINWLEPRDLTVDDVLAAKNTPESPGASSWHEYDGDREGAIWRSAPLFLCSCQDLRTGPVRSDASREALKALLTIDGGEDVRLEEVRPPAGRRLSPLVQWLMGIETLFVAIAIVRRVRLARQLIRKAA